MTSLGRVVVTVAVAAVVIGLTVVGVYYLRGDAPAKELPRTKPEVVSTPDPSRARDVGAGDDSPAVRQVLYSSGGAGGARAAPAAPAGPAASGVSLTGTAPVVLSDTGADVGLAAAREGRLVEAQKLLSDALRKGIAGSRAQDVRTALAEVTDKLMFSATTPAGYAYIKAYEVVSGDSLTTIGRRFMVPLELVQKMNRLGSDRLTVGQKLRVLQGPITVEISKSRFELQAWCGDACLKSWPIAIGKEDSTPDGTFVVTKKLRNPPYQPQHKPKSFFRESGAPDNPLGSRWIDLGNHYGIHGTIDPTSIGKEASEGCIRMHSKDVEELFDLVVPGASKVTIRS